MRETNTSSAVIWAVQHSPARQLRWFVVLSAIVIIAGTTQAQSPDTPRWNTLDHLSDGNWWSTIAQSGPSPNALSQRAATQAGDDQATSDDQTNNGEDFTRPLNRFDIRYKYEQQKNTIDTHTLTLRADSKLTLPSDWQLSTRVDLPMPRNNKPGSENPNGDYEAGLGDVLTQALLITPHVHRMAAAGGLRVTWPTETESQLGNQEYVLGPILGAAYYPTWLPKGSLLGTIARYEFRVAGKGEEIDRLIVQPLVNINLPDRWFVNFQPEMAMNCRQDNKWFIPFDVALGKKIGKHMIVSVEWKQGLLKDYNQYDWSMEFRIGFFF